MWIGALLGAFCLVGVARLVARRRWYSRYAFVDPGGRAAFVEPCGHPFARPFARARVSHILGRACGRGLRAMDSDDVAPYDPWRRGRRRRTDGVSARPASLPFDRIFDRLDATPAQRRIILSAAAEVGARTHALTTDLGGIRRELADSIRGDRIDEAAFARASEQAQALARSLGDPLGRTLVKVHECLDPRQRHILADLVEHGFV